MRRSLLASLTVLLAFASGCATQASENFYAVRKGMTKAEVEDLLGKPSSTWVVADGIDRWQWGDNLSSLATAGVFRDADTNRVWAVWFDSEGKVTDLSEPAWSRE
jgi:outer membrane protein assembly factor BamE (lipoprotein component of BamABCDE complex)